MNSIRRALVLGNGRYAGTTLLRSPKNDAETVATALEALQFRVTLGADLEHEEMFSLINGFIEGLRKERTHVALIYYSGHGVQLGNENFLVPIDFDHDQEHVKLVSVQEVMDEVSEHCNQKIVILDACRSNFDAKQVANGKNVELKDGKTIFVGGIVETGAGLAEMRASGNAFIAFAAAPGDVAYEGGESLSPFTEALVRYIDAVDLPLSNLMSRVRQEVLGATGQQQRTWDHSSLIAPFYFNPGSMFLFMGNALAFVGFILSMLPYSLILASPERTISLVLMSLSLPFIAMSILLYGIQTVYGRLHGDFRSERRTSALPAHIIDSVMKGGLGGFLGSLIAAVVITAVYERYWSGVFNGWVAAVASGQDPPSTASAPPPPLGEMAFQNAVAAAAGACALGSLALLFARVDIGRNGLKLASSNSIYRLLLGTALGGTLGGIICAPIMTWYFAGIFGPRMTPDLLLPGSIVGTAFIVFSIVNFDFERLSARRLMAGAAGSFSAIFVGGFLSLVLFAILHASGLASWLESFIAAGSSSAAQVMVGGALYGMPVGFLLGVTVGLAIVFTDRWSTKPLLAAG